MGVDELGPGPGVRGSGDCLEILVQNMYCTSQSWNRVLLFLSHTVPKLQPVISGWESVALNTKPSGTEDLESWPLKY